MLSRLLRTSFLTGFLVTLVAATLLAAPTLWYWISTEPQPARSTAPFEFGVDIWGKVRVLRWGDHQGLRHGRFLAEWADRELHGEYDRGELSGTWREVDRASGDLVSEALPIREDDSDALESVRLLGCSLRLSHSDNPECVIDGFPHRIPLTGHFLLVRKADHGCWVSGGSLSGEGIEIDHPGVFLRPDGTVSILLSDGLRTEFDEQNAIVRQAMRSGGEESDVRTSPPWFDPVTGDEAWLMEPASGRGDASP